MKKKIETLHPELQKKAYQHKDLCKQNGIELRIYMALRTWDEQAELYSQGRTKPGKIITNAKAGYSWHNFALAYDCVEIKDGKAIWDNTNWNKIGELGKQCDLEWGGDWKSFKDRPHFEWHPKLSLIQARDKYQRGEELIPIQKPINKKIVAIEDNVIHTNFQPSTISQVINFIKNIIKKFV